jgi:hypothetical protein
MPKQNFTEYRKANDDYKKAKSVEDIQKATNRLKEIEKSIGVYTSSQNNYSILRQWTFNRFSLKRCRFCKLK